MHSCVGYAFHFLWPGTKDIGPSTIARPLAVSRYFCLELLGFSGIIISIKPFSNAGLRYRSRKFACPFNPRIVWISALVLGFAKLFSSWMTSPVTSSATSPVTSPATCRVLVGCLSGACRVLGESRRTWPSSDPRPYPLLYPVPEWRDRRPSMIGRSCKQAPGGRGPARLHASYACRREID